MSRLRIGTVRYLNVWPLVDGLEVDRDVELVRAVPSRIGEQLASGEVDIGLVSVVDALRPGGEPLTLLPVGMIGCRGSTLTVRVFSACPPDRIGTLYADTDSHTSVLLARLLLREAYGASVSVVDFHARERAGLWDEGSPAESWPPSVLLIGDKVVVDCPPAVRYAHQIDLGELWHERTGRPFAYAVWACRTADLSDPARAGAIGAAAALLDRQRRRNAARIDWVISRRSEESGWPLDLARRYLGELLRYEVGGEELEGIAEFASRLDATGILPGARMPPVAGVRELLGGAVGA